MGYKILMKYTILFDLKFYMCSFKNVIMECCFITWHAIKNFPVFPMANKEKLISWTIDFSKSANNGFKESLKIVSLLSYVSSDKIQLMDNWSQNSCKGLLKTFKILI